VAGQLAFTLLQYSTGNQTQKRKLLEICEKHPIKLPTKNNGEV